MEKLSQLSKKKILTLRPNFLIPGSGRSGSTFLYSCLKQHPQILFSTIKEPSYFSKYYDLGEKWYLNHFKSRKDFPVVAESSTQYFYSVEATKRIYDFNPDFKLIFIIRNPVNRAFSNYNREVQMWGESRTFEEIIENDDRYTWPAMYYTHLSRYFKYFPSSQVKILIFEKFIKNVENNLREICEFLKINSDFKFDPGKFKQNPSKMPISPRLQKLNKKYFELNRREPLLIQTFRVGCRSLVNFSNHLFYKSREIPGMKEATKKYLKDFFNEEILKLEDLLDEDLSIWKQ